MKSSAKLKSCNIQLELVILQYALNRLNFDIPYLDLFLLLITFIFQKWHYVWEIFFNPVYKDKTLLPCSVPPYNNYIITGAFLDYEYVWYYIYMILIWFDLIRVSDTHHISSADSRKRVKSRRTTLWFVGWLGLYQTRKWRIKRPSTGTRSVFTEQQLHAIAGESSATYTGCHPKNRVMAPLSLPLSSLLKHKDCVRRANIFCNTLHGLHQRPFRPLLWKRNLGAVAHGVGQLLSHHPGAKNHAASACNSSSDGRDMTEKLWSAYKQTKRQTEGMGRSSQCLQQSNKSPSYNPLMTDVSSRSAQFLQPHVSSSFCTLILFYLTKTWHK